MSKTAAIFSGQGAQYPGMGVDLREKYKSARDIYACAGDILGFDVASMSDTGSEEQLARTSIAQPLIYTLSLAAYTAARETVSGMGDPACVAGHSLGEYAALYAAGAFGLEDGFRIIKARSAAMEEAAKSCPGAMYAILGSDEDTVRAACEAVEGFVVPANFNLPGQTVISGEEKAAAKAAEVLAGQGAKTVRLSVGSAFHTKIMQPAAVRFKSEISGICFSPVKLPFYSNLTGGELLIEDYPDYFARHMTSPVRFVEQVAAMAGAGVSYCVEYGPKKTASALVKKNNKSITVYGVEDSASVEKLKEAYDMGGIT